MKVYIGNIGQHKNQAFRYVNLIWVNNFSKHTFLCQQDNQKENSSLQVSFSLSQTFLDVEYNSSYYTCMVYFFASQSYTRHHVYSLP